MSTEHCRCPHRRGGVPRPSIAGAVRVAAVGQRRCGLARSRGASSSSLQARPVRRRFFAIVGVAARLAWLGGLVPFSGCGAAPDAATTPAPRADAGYDQVVSIGSEVTLDASQSVGDGELAFAWELLSQPEGSAASLQRAATAEPAFTADVAGRYFVSLVVSANGVQSAPDFATVTARNRGPVATAQCGSPTDCRVLHGRQATLDGSGSFDPDGDALQLQWEQVTEQCPQRCPELTDCIPYTESVDPQTPTEAIAAFTAPATRDVDVVFALSVSDGRRTDTSCVAFEVYNTPPNISMAASDPQLDPPTNPTTVTEGTDFRLAVAPGQWDPDGDPLSWSWAQVSVSDPSALEDDSTFTSPTNSETRVTAPSLSDGPVTVTYRITADDGLDTDSATIEVEVTAQ